VILNQLAVPRLQDVPGLEILKKRKYQILFARAGASADLVFSVANGGKTDPEMNAVLHDQGFHAELYRRCLEAEDEKCQAFALGLVGHAAADHAGNRPESASAANVFGWSTDEDVFGDPASSPERSAAAQLRTVTVGVNKILIDGLLRKHRIRWRLYSPFVEEGHLTAALQVYDGPHSLPNDTEEERAAIASNVDDYERRFSLAYTVLRVLGRRVHDNGNLSDPLDEVYGGDVDELPAIQASVDEIVAAVSRLVSGAPAPAMSMAAFSRSFGPDCHDLTGSMEGLQGVVSRHVGPRSPMFGAAADQDEGGDDPEPSTGPAPPLPGKGAGGGSPAKNRALSALRKEVMTEVGKNVLVPRRSWGHLRSIIRDLVPIELPEGESAPAGPAGPEPISGGGGDLFGIR
jgi:hypothetical protein